MSTPLDMIVELNSRTQLLVKNAVQMQSQIQKQVDESSNYEQSKELAIEFEKYKKNETLKILEFIQEIKQSGLSNMEQVVQNRLVDTENLMRNQINEIDATIVVLDGKIDVTIYSSWLSEINIETERILNKANSELKFLKERQSTNKIDDKYYQYLEKYHESKISAMEKLLKKFEEKKKTLYSDDLPNQISIPILEIESSLNQMLTNANNDYTDFIKERSEIKRNLDLK